MNSIWILLSLAANHDWPLQQFDVKNVFLHGNLEQEVFMDPLLGFEDQFNKRKVCKFKKTLYELKQSSRAWFGKFTLYLSSSLVIEKVRVPWEKINHTYHLRWWNGIYISQRKYIFNLLNETGMIGCKPTDAPTDPNQKLATQEGSVLVDKWRYQKADLSISYLARHCIFCWSCKPTHACSPWRTHGCCDEDLKASKSYPKERTPVFKQ